MLECYRNVIEAKVRAMMGNLHTTQIVFVQLA